MSRSVTTPPKRTLRKDGTLLGGWWHTADQDDRIVCDLCPRACNMKPGDRGFCFVRQNIDGEMVLTTFGRSTGFCIDPIEKKPLNHFYPGTPVLSFGTAGCNLGCKFCQNWDISKSREVSRLSELAMPEMIAAAAKEHGCHSVAYTYNDPIIWAEYAIQTAQACREIGIHSVAVTAGYIQPEARAPFFHAMDAANVDLKSFSEEFYHKITYSHLQPVLETLQWLKHESDVWFEITNLVIPDANDSDDELRQMCEWILESVGDDVPIHFSAFHPDYRMQDRPRTPHETLLRARELAIHAGLQYAYVGNVNDVANQSTYCHSCGELLIERNWYELGVYHLTENRCGHCQATIPGRFADGAGTWGRKRLPIKIANYQHTDPQTVQISGKTQEPDMTDAITAGKVSLSKKQQKSLHTSVCEFVNHVVHGRDVELSDPTMGGTSEFTIMGAFVTLKRGEQLRGCCGSLGRPMRLIEAIYNSAYRTAKEDTRLPPISPTELRYLTLDITLLSNFQPIKAVGQKRVDCVEIGKHGLRISRGNNAGLLLPSVATDRDWDAETFLQQVCRKAGLPVTAWQDSNTELMTFDGDMIEGDFNAEVFMDGDETIPPPVDEPTLLVLQKYAHRNVHAIATNQAPSPSIPGFQDIEVNGVTIRLMFEGDGSGVSFSTISMRPRISLQATLFASCQSASKWLLEHAPGAIVDGFKVELVIHSDPALHGTLASNDLDGLDTNSRTILVSQQQQSGWAFDPSETLESLLKTAKDYAQCHSTSTTSVYSLNTVSTTDEFGYSNAPSAQLGTNTRMPAVAGAFYPADPDELKQQVDSFLEDAAKRRTGCAAVMVPHAGWRFSGHLAAKALGRIKIPDTVIVIGPKHTRLGVRWAIAPNETWQMPGFTMQSDIDLAQQLAKEIDGLEMDSAAHQREHSIEVELPFIHALNPNAKIVGIALGAADWDACQRFSTGLAKVLKQQETPPLLVISSDMNHYASDEENRRLDEMALQALETLEPQNLFDTVTNNSISMCGMVPCVAVMEALKKNKKLKKATRIGYATSADVSGDPNRVVGYASVLLN